MTRKNFWQLAAILLVLLLFVPFIFPPRGHDFTQDFLAQAKNRDAAFSNLVERFTAMQKTNAGRAYGNLKEAIGTNDLMKYFPQYTAAKNEKNPNGYILSRLQRGAAGKIRLGLDLQGGTRYLVTMDMSKLGTNSDRGTALSHGVEVIRRRVDSLGVAEPVIQALGENRIEVQLPGLSESDKERARALIQKAAFLEFRMVHADSDLLIAKNIIEPGYEVMTLEQKVKKDGREEKVTRRHLVNKKPELTGEHIKRAEVVRDQFSNKPEITFELDKEGAKIFEKVTTEWQPKGDRKYQLAIVLDGELRSAPSINSVISSSGRIMGDFDQKEALDLKNTLENPLQAPVVVEAESSVDPLLGADTVKKGLQAAIFGTMAVAGFMLIYYLRAGLVANVALALNIVILLGVLCGLETTITMPGIAGIVLTIGMAVDANVLIFERIREELAAGKTMRGALAAGYDKAFGTIFDSNLTTLIASVTLIFMGTGPVKGFGVTLTVGVTVSMFTALVVTRLIFDYFLSRGWLTGMKMLHLIRGANIDFLRWAVPAFAASWLLIFIGNGYGLYRGKEALGVEFAGGDSMNFAFKQKVDQGKISAAIKSLNVGEPTVGYQRDAVSGAETLRVTTRVVDEKSANVPQRVLGLLQTEFKDAGFASLGGDHIGPTIGKEIRRTAIVAALLAMFLILVYVAFRYEISFAVGAVVAIVHDLLMTSGWFFLTGREMSGPFVAAMLTIIGFSINDTIVIFDRIREDLRMGLRGTFKELMNHALNRTLSRTIITSGTVFLATLSLYLFGGGVINDFSFTFLVGILTGTYSSIYIASALVLWWHKGQRPALGAGVGVESAATVRAPAAVRA
ncbi:MAG TPA: protein translocase subunit SecD [Verrucomicrobiae bacterium]|nr:protein translocase subunit SecD [Verrucomicrobiae bacterium]